jgi:mono/diheme cytochrome c family protein
VRRLVALAVLAVLAVGCSDGVPGGKVATPTPETIVGKVPTAPSAPKGNSAAGKPVFVSTGCGACHAFAPAATTGKVGPDLDKLADYAQKANQGSVTQFTQTSIVNPNAYIEPGFAAGVMPPTYGQTLKPQQLADLVAFLTQGT